MGIFFKNLNEKPVDAMLKKLINYGLIAVIGIYIIMGYFMWLSGTDLTQIMASQLYFNAEKLHDLYWETPYLDFYTVGQCVDYAFMIAYGSSLFAGTVKMARKYPADSKMRKVGLTISEMPIFAAIFDAFENMFILITLDNPFGFSDWVAIAMSCVSLVKWILLFIAIGYNVFAIFKKAK
jgi:hypothetical protein